MALTQTAHGMIRQHLQSADIDWQLAVDATCGNGHDTLFLSTLGFKKIIAFDIQAPALSATKERLQRQSGTLLKLYQCGHQSMLDYVAVNTASCIMFNFGYLPQSDKSVVTLAESSWVAIQAALQALHPNGIISLLCYPGHEEGRKETNLIQDHLKQLGKDWCVRRIDSPTISDHSPILFLAHTAD